MQETIWRCNESGCSASVVTKGDINHPTPQLRFGKTKGHHWHPAQVATAVALPPTASSSRQTENEGASKTQKGNQKDNEERKLGKAGKILKRAHSPSTGMCGKAKKQVNRVYAVDVVLALMESGFIFQNIIHENGNKITYQYPN